MRVNTIKSYNTMSTTHQGTEPFLGRMSSRAFTLTELLVVIAIITILAALVFPVLAQAKQKARSAQCRNGLRQWVTAFLIYKDEHDEFIPREGHWRDGRVRRDNWANVRDPNNGDVWYNALPHELRQLPASKYFSRITGQRPKFYQTQLFHCPSAKFADYFGVDDEAYFSLAMNSKLIQNHTIRFPESSIRYSAIEQPSETVAFLDARVNRTERKVHPFQVDTELGQPSAQATRFAARHGAGGNLAFADGRVAWHRGPEVVETRSGRRCGAAIFPDSEIIWSADPLDDPNVSD